MRTSMVTDKNNCLILDFTVTEKTGIWTFPRLRKMMTNLSGPWKEAPPPVVRRHGGKGDASEVSETEDEDEISVLSDGEA